MRFQKGESGNPAGKPKGTPTKVTKLRAFLEPHAEDLIAKAVEMAKAGDGVALRLCLERLIPACKAEGRAVPLSGLEASALPADQGRAVIEAVAAGTLTLNEGAALMQTVAGLARVIEVDELERRVAALEAKGANGK